MAYALSDEARIAFQRDGFVAIDQLITPPEIDQIRSILLGLHEDNVGFKEGAQFDAAAPDGDVNLRRFPQIIHPRVYAPELNETNFHKVGYDIARQILGDTARFKGDISFLKPARIGSSTPWHQDEAFGNPAFDHREISIWLALTPANATNSCMSFIPGSHQLPILDHRPMGGDPRIHALECVGAFDPSKAVECPLSSGDCTIHTGRTLHYAGPNHSSDFRLAYVVMYDTPPTLRAKPHTFTWSEQQKTDRAAREQAWRRRGGIILHLWRYRHRLRSSRVVSEIYRALKAWSSR